MTIQGGDAIPVAPEFQLGVLLVHGIGIQRSGDTLVHWGDVLLKTIERATRKRVEVTVERAGGADLGKGQVEAAVLVRAGDHSERWLLSEAWWADAFPAPSYRELFIWSTRALPWSIVTHVAERYWRASSRDWDLTSIGAVVRALGRLLLALVFAPLLISLLGLALLLGMLPIPQIRKAILAVQSTLTATVGDSFAFVESPLRAAIIRTCILDGLDRVKRRCRHTVIIAHSQGAAAVLDALGGMTLAAPDGQVEPALRVIPDALVTFGAGTNQLASQKLLSAGLPESLGTKFLWKDPVLTAVLGFLSAAGLLLWVCLSTPLKDILRNLVLVGLNWSVLLAVLSATKWAAVSLSERYKRVVRVTGELFVIMPGLIFVGLELWYDVLPAASSYHLFSALIVLGGSLVFILSDNMKKIAAARVRKPPGLVRWVDLYASADPVPNGPTRTDAGGHDSIQIWNRGCMVSDHTSYWDNRDGFVLRVAKVCAETAGSSWLGVLPDTPRFVDERARWRVGFLQRARLSAGVIWLVLGACLYRYQAFIPIPFDIPDWVPAPVVRPVLLATFIALAMWATFVVLRWPWNWWVRVEQDAVLAHEQPGRGLQGWYPGIIIYLMGALVWMPIVATGSLMIIMIENSNALQISLYSGIALGALQISLYSGIALGSVLAFFSAFVLLLWKRPPPRPEIRPRINS
jgi:hypothetical protein